MKPAHSTSLLRFLAATLILSTAACSSSRSEKRVAGPAVPPQKEDPKPRGGSEYGLASIYKDHRTASGEPYRASALAAAHKKLPLRSRAKVTNLRNGKSVVVRINDRGPYIRGRIIDLTPAAASKLGFGWKQGIVRVKVERI